MLGREGRKKRRLAEQRACQDAMAWTVGARMPCESVPRVLRVTAHALAALTSWSNKQVIVESRKESVLNMSTPVREKRHIVTLHLQGI